MFTSVELDKVLNQDIIQKNVAEKLLSIYVCETEWWPHVKRLHDILTRKHGRETATAMVRESIAFTILFPTEDKTIRIDCDNPGNNLFKWRSFHQFESKTWLEELKKVIRRDVEISDYRKKTLSLGVIDPIDYQPFCRQAYEWICQHADKSGVELTQGRLDKYRGFVMVYGGAVISYMFEKHTTEVKNVTNWRTPYFLERNIFKVYSLDQVLKIKTMEMDRTNSKLVKKINKIGN